jgi:Tol biopolymer transport system component
MNRRVMTKAAALSGAVAFLVGTAPTTAQATFAGANGRIAFYRVDENGFTQVWTANPDLSAAHQLTAGDAFSGWPSWAPDASRIAFDSNSSDPDPTDSDFVNDVFTMRPDGTDVRKVTDSVGFSGDAAYSPDGRLIAFDSDRDVVNRTPEFPAATPDLSVYVIAADGTGMRRVTTPPAGASDTEPRFSPDGQKVLFSRFRGVVQASTGHRVARDTSAIFTVNLDGSGERRLTGWGHKTGQADWSPDGQQIVFEMACCRLAAAGIFTVRADGSGFHAVVNGRGLIGIGNDSSIRLDGYYDPVWSPDGTKIVAGHEFFDDGVFQQGLVVVDADGSNLHWLANETHEDHQPDWGTAPLE